MSTVNKTKLTEIWDTALSLIREDIADSAYKTWFDKTQLLSINNNVATISCHNDFAATWLEERFSELITGFLENILKTTVKVEFMPIDSKEYNQSKNNPSELADSNRNSNTIQNKPSFLLSKYTFDTFVVGNSNRFTHAACLAVGETPAKAYNPLFIYGGVGLGKTHLMHAIGHMVQSHSPNAKVLYVSTEKFTNEMISSIQNNATEKFRNKYRNIDVLLIDDIQFLERKESTQEEFFHTFNALHESSKQIVISSDRPPKDIPTLEDRLRSRFEWGLITDIQTPDFETRVAILRKKADLEDYILTDKILSSIAERVRTNIRELEGALVRVVAYSQINSIPFEDITDEVVGIALKDVIISNQAMKIDIKRIIEVVGEYYNLRIDDFVSKKRTRTIAYPRQIAMYLSREMTDLPLIKIGEEFGGRDHTTVMHAIDKIGEEIKESHDLKNIVKSLEKQIKNS
ncbi:chromosomal replication initiator protein DnaA [Clostridia bacterium]|nr:chromosomal replication initiator protein DnaA [Clostridia bacterium]